MALRAWGEVAYLPILSLRPAEMRALEELPNLTKDRLLPIIHLRPWVGSHRLENSTGRILDAYDDRPVVIAMGDSDQQNDHPVHAQLDALRDASEGFRQWCEFLEANDNYIPAIQFSSLIAEEEAQINRLFGLGRGLVVIIDQRILTAIDLIAQRVGQRTQGGLDVCFVIDFGTARRDHLELAARTLGFIATLRQHAPLAAISVSASSFPDSFTELSEQPIFERQLFNTLSTTDVLIYSDRGSARVERPGGGGGPPVPRIDYPLLTEWKFFRSDDRAGFPGYQQQARALKATLSKGIWNPNLRVWGTQMIERTAAGDTSAIGGPQKATAARINLHLQRQTFYDDPPAAENTDEDWSG